MIVTLFWCRRGVLFAVASRMIAYRPLLVGNPVMYPHSVAANASLQCPLVSVYHYDFTLGAARRPSCPLGVCVSVQANFAYRRDSFDKKLLSAASPLRSTLLLYRAIPSLSHLLWPSSEELLP